MLRLVSEKIYTNPCTLWRNGVGNTKMETLVAGLSFARLILMNDKKISKNIFLWDRHMCCNNWLSSEMVEILSECGLGHCFLSRVQWILHI